MKIVKLFAELKNQNIYLHVENGYLKYKSQRKLSDEMINKLKKNEYEIINFLTKVNTQSYFINDEIEIVNRNGILPISPVQHSMLFFDKLTNGSSLFNITNALRIKGNLNIDYLEKALNNIIKRHENLRSVYSLSEGKPVVNILNNINIKINKIDLNETKQKNIFEIGKEESKFKFNLSKGPLFKLLLLMINENEYVLFCTIHHIISDAWSNSIFVKEIMLLYESYANDLNTSFPDLKVQFIDYVNWHNKLLKSDFLLKKIKYWKKKLKGASLLNIPTDYLRPAIPSYEGGCEEITISENLSTSIKKFSNQNNISLFILLFTAYNILLHKYSSRDDIIVAAVSPNRDLPVFEKIIGCFINTIVIRSKLHNDLSLIDALKIINKNVNEALDNKSIPFDRILNELNIHREINRNPLFQSMFILQNSENINLKIKGLEIENIDIDFNKIPFDMRVQIFEMNNGIKVKFEYWKELFLPETIKKMQKHYVNILEMIINNIDYKLIDINLKNEIIKNQKYYYDDKNNQNIKTEIPYTLNIASSFTIEPIEEFLIFWLTELGIPYNIRFSPYSQVFQQLLKSDSIFNQNIEKSLNLIFIRFEDWIKSKEKSFNIPDFFNNCLIQLNNEFKILIEKFQENNNHPLFIVICPPSAKIQNNITLNKYLIDVENDLTAFLLRLKNVFILKPEDIFNFHKSFDDYYVEISDRQAGIPYTRKFFTSLGTALMRKVSLLFRKQSKVIVLDCDNTLWQGVCGEIGANVVISKSYSFFQKLMASLSLKGILLCLCSKNVEEDVFNVFENNKNMILTKEHLTGWKINWKNKSENIRELSEELQLGIDSFIFIDDNPVECAEVEAVLPGVTVLLLPEKLDDRIEYFKNLWVLDILSTTKEDKKRTEFYKQEFKRKELKKSEFYLSDFIKKLDLKINIKEKKTDQIERISQLTQRTNQFNATVKRRTVQDLFNLFKNGYKCYVTNVEDRFGDYGLVGVIIYKIEKNEMEIDTFLLSCRALGRGVEHRMLSELVKIAEKESIDSINLIFCITSKNIPAMNFFDNLDLTEVTRSETKIIYKIQVNTTCNVKFNPYLYENKQQMKNNPGKKTDNNNIKYNFFTDEKIKKIALDFNTPEKILKYCELHKKYEENIVTDYKAPGNNIEKKLQEIWQKELGKIKISINDNFFHIGGNSLNAMSLIAQIHKKFNIELTIIDFFQNSTIKNLASLILKSEKNIYSSIIPASEKNYYPVSSAQKRMYILNQMDKTSTGYNETLTLLLEGNPDIEHLEAVFNDLVNRHESLRTSFKLIDNKIVQKIFNNIQFKIYFKEINEAFIEEEINMFIKPFDLSCAPLIRTGLFKLSENKFLLVVDMHHIITDGTSITILADEFRKLYKGEKLDKLIIQYKDYAEWQQKLLLDGKLDKQKNFWIKLFNDELPVLNIPLDYKRPKTQNFEGNRLKFCLSKEESDKLKSLITPPGVTFYMILLGILNILLSKYSGQEDIIIGSPIANRSHHNLSRVVGIFVNTLAMRTKLNNQSGFQELLTTIKENTLTAYENQDFQFEDLLESLNIQRDIERNPLFDVMLVLQNMNESNAEVKGLKISEYFFDKKTTKCDLTFEVFDKDNGININVEYCIKLFKKETIEKLVKHLFNIIHQVCENPDIKIKDIDILENTEKNKLLNEFNNTNAYFNENICIHEIFEQKVKKYPGNIAVVYKENKLTYKQLNEKSNQLARILRSKGISKDKITGILAEKNLEMIISMLGIIKSGGAYLPLDPDYPADRINYILKDSNCQILLTTNKNLIEKINFEGEVLLLDDNLLRNENVENLNNINTSNDLLYMIYTSGSTGLPKGVMLEHRGLLNLNYFYEHDFKIEQNDKILQFASFSFDASVSEIFMALLSGASLYLISKNIVLDHDLFYNFLNENQITIATLPPAFAIHLDPGKIKYLRMLLTAGSSSNNKIVNKWKKSLQYINAYGPTETTICATTWNAPLDDSIYPYDYVPIGKPIYNTRIYILDKNMKLVPAGVIGEIYISGKSVARGYHNNEKLTREKFLQDPFYNDCIMYKTGDLGRWLPDGNIEFTGRIDHQVKIRGYRVELGEIENKLSKCPLINDSIVTIFNDSNDGNNFICCYFTSDKDLNIQEIKNYLSEELPGYMIPSYFIKLSKIPLTPNGKPDLKNLPHYSDFLKTRNEYLPPEDEIEKKLVKIWEEVLQLDKVGINEDFFEIGGDSIKILQIKSSLKNIGLDIEIQDFMKHPEIRLLKKYIKSKNFLNNEKKITGKVRLLPMQLQFFSFNITDLHYWNTAIMFHSKNGFDIKIIKDVFNKITEHHDALRFLFKFTDLGVEQICSDLDKSSFDLVTYNLTEYPDFAEKIIKLSEKEFAGLNITKGPILKLILFKTLSGDHLVICIHHLISDNISLRIIGEDFEKGYRQAVNNEPIILHDKTSNLLEWSNYLYEYSQSPDLWQQYDYWKTISDLNNVFLPVDDKIAKNKHKDRNILSINLDVKYTKKLIKSQEIENILLTGLSMLLKGWINKDHIVIEKATHGRKGIQEKIDLSRTVGFLAVNFPVYLDLSIPENIENQLNIIRTMNKRIPERGPGYMVLEYITLKEKNKPGLFKERPELFFNYHGIVEELNEDKYIFNLSKIACGDSTGGNTERIYKIYIDSVIYNSELEIRITYNKKEYRESTINTLLDQYKIKLKKILDFIS